MKNIAQEQPENNSQQQPLDYWRNNSLKQETYDTVDEVVRLNKITNREYLKRVKSSRQAFWQRFGGR